jgi:hypothetical protein
MTCRKRVYTLKQERYSMRGKKTEKKLPIDKLETQVVSERVAQMYQKQHK